MLLNSLLFILILLIRDFRIGLIISITLLIINSFINKDIKSDIKKLKFFMIFYLMTCLSQIFFNQEGKVMFKFLNIYITDTGIEKMLLNFFKINSLVFLSWLIKTKGKLGFKLFSYELIIEIIIEMIPQVFSLFKNKVGVKNFYKKILLKVYRKL